jgi:hypothetical protein
MRLQTNPDDLYTWTGLEGKEHLFAKSIRDHPVSVLRELYNGIGKSFEAIAKALRQGFKSFKEIMRS